MLIPAQIRHQLAQHLHALYTHRHGRGVRSNCRRWRRCERCPEERGHNEGGCIEEEARSCAQPLNCQPAQRCAHRKAHAPQHAVQRRRLLQVVVRHKQRTERSSERVVLSSRGRLQNDEQDHGRQGGCGPQKTHQQAAGGGHQGNGYEPPPLVAAIRNAPHDRSQHCGRQQPTEDERRDQQGAVLALTLRTQRLENGTQAPKSCNAHQALHHRQHSHVCGRPSA